MGDELVEPAFRTWGEYWAIAVRRRWWVLLPLFLIWACVYGVSWLLPEKYQSESLILVEQQKVPDQYVVPNVTGDLQERLRSLTEQVLSRTRLQSTIDRLHLYPKTGSLQNMADAVEQMRADIKIELVSAPDRPGEYTAFRMRYSAGSPELAQRVNGELSSLFIAENVNARRELSENTTAFLEDRLAEARSQMAEQETRVAAFKSKHLGDLPNQLESNMEILRGLQSQRQSAQQTLDAAGQQKIYLESLLQQYQSSSSDVGTGSTAPTPEELLEKQIDEMRLRLQQLQTRYTEEHPDIRALKSDIAKTERLRQSAIELSAKQSSPAIAHTGDSGPAASTQKSGPIMQVQSQLKANALEISNIQQHLTNIDAQITSYQSRLNVTPETEQELTDISRGYDESKTNYDSLLQKKMQSQLATSLEDHLEGEQFRIVDPPSLPSKPSAPNHLMFSLAGLFSGLVAGLALAAVCEFTNARVQHERDLADIVPAKILIDIPHLNMPGEATSRVWRWRTELGAASALAVLVLLGNLYAFLKG